MTRWGKFFWIGMLSATALLAFLVWFPWIEEVRISRARLDQLQWSYAERERSLHSLLEEVVVQREALEKTWAGLHTGMIVASSPTAAGTKLLGQLQDLAREAGVDLQSSGLLPPDLSRHPGLLTVDLRGAGGKSSVYEFLYRLSEGPPAYRLHRVRLEQRPGQDRLYFEFVVNTLWSNRQVNGVSAANWNDMSPTTFSSTLSKGLSLFGPMSSVPVADHSYETEWSVVGIVQGRYEALAILRHPGGRQQLVQVGDTIGDEEVIAIESTHVLLGRGDARSRITIPVESLGPTEGEVATCTIEQTC